MWSELGIDENGRVKMWKVCDMGLVLSTKKGKKKTKKIENENDRNEKMHDSKIGGSVEIGMVEKRRRIFENDQRNLLLNNLTKHEVAPKMKLSLEEENLVPSLKMKKNPEKDLEMRNPAPPAPLSPRKISTTERDRCKTEDLIMGISPRSKIHFSSKTKIKQASGKIKMLRKVFEGASPLKQVRTTNPKLKFFAVETKADSVSTNGRQESVASLGTTL